MSFLEMEKGIDNFSKAVISFWFICPKANLSSEGSVDLLVFGDRPKTAFTIARATDDATMTERFSVIGLDCAVSHVEEIEEFLGTNTVLSIEGLGKTPPCYITLGSNGEKFVLSVRLQMSNAGSGVGYGPFTGSTQADGVLGTANFYGCGTTETDDCGGTASYLEALTQTFSITDNTSATLANTPDYFDIGGSSVGLKGSRSCEIEPDVWHHVLLSFDLTGTISAKGSFTTIHATQGVGGGCYEGETDPGSISSSCKVWMAIDDENVFGQSLVPTAFPERNLGRNDLISINSHNFASGGGTAALTERNFVTMYNGTLDRNDLGFWIKEFPERPRPSYSYTPGVIKAKGHPVGVPSTKDWGIDETPVSIQHCEMAELQIFTGVTLDTGKEENRRMFLAPKKATKDKKTEPGLFPVKPKDTEELIKQKPIVLLHGSGNWKSGKNTGTSALNVKVEAVAAGQFVPTGRIEKYKPDPVIGEPPPPPPPEPSPTILRAYGPPRIMPRTTAEQAPATTATTGAMMPTLLSQKGFTPTPLSIPKPEWSPKEGLILDQHWPKATGYPREQS